MNCFEYCVPFAIMFFLHILILYHLLEEVIFTLYYLYTTTNHNFSKEKLRFIKQHKLGTIQPDTASSGYCIFQRVAFDLKKLAELDPEGTKRFMERNGIRQRDVPKQKQKKKQRLQRER